MSPEKQRIAVAEACGWTPCWQLGTLSGWFSPVGIPQNQLPKPLAGLPDYLNSLDAVHEAEKVLTAKQLPVYSQLLTEALSNAVMATESSPIANIYEWHATANQRAEAFLRALNRWDDSK